MTTALAVLPKDEESALSIVGYEPDETEQDDEIIDVEVLAKQNARFEYQYAPISELRVRTTEDPKTGKKVVTAILLNDEPLVPSDRFWTSIFARYGFNSAFFKYFEHEETFNRISQVESNDRMRLCIERGDDGTGYLLAVSNPNRPIVAFDDLIDLLNKHRSQDVTYHNGIVESRHDPRMAGNRFEVPITDADGNQTGVESYYGKFIMSCPIDGYGMPNIYLAAFREHSRSNIVAYAKLFKSGLGLGKGEDDVSPTLTRALDGFNNEEGYAAIQQRLMSAATSWMSVYESTQLYKLLVRLHGNKMLGDVGSPWAVSIEEWLKANAFGQIKPPGEEDETLGSPVIKAFHGMTGDTSRLYGLANLDALSAKRQKTLPVRATVLDGINFASEAAQHFAEPAGARLLQGWIGNTLSEEYDMEGTKVKFGRFEDFHVQRRIEQNLTG